MRGRSRPRDRGAVLRRQRPADRPGRRADVLRLIAKERREAMEVRRTDREILPHLLIDLSDGQLDSGPDLDRGCATVQELRIVVVGDPELLIIRRPDRRVCYVKDAVQVDEDVVRGSSGSLQDKRHVVPRIERER